MTVCVKLEEYKNNIKKVEYEIEMSESWQNNKIQVFIFVHLLKWVGCSAKTTTVFCERHCSALIRLIQAAIHKQGPHVPGVTNTLSSYLSSIK